MIYPKPYSIYLRGPIEWHGRGGTQKLSHLDQAHDPGLSSQDLGLVIWGCMGLGFSASQPLKPNKTCTDRKPEAPQKRVVEFASPSCWRLPDRLPKLPEP